MKALFLQKDDSAQKEGAQQQANQRGEIAILRRKNPLVIFWSFRKERIKKEREGFEAKLQAFSPSLSRSSDHFYFIIKRKKSQSLGVIKFFLRYKV